MRVGGTTVGNVLWGGALFLAATVFASIGLRFPPGPALAWLAVCGTVFVWLHARSSAPGRPSRAAAIIRMRAPGASLKWIVIGAPAMMVFGLGAGGLLQLWTGPIHSPIAPSGPNELEELVATPGGWLVLTAYATVLAPVIEEFCFRGWIQRSLERRTGPALAITVSAVLFALAHVWYGGLGFLVMPLVLGIVWGGAVVLTGSIWSGVILHGAWNWTMMLAVRYAADPGAIFLLPDTGPRIILLTALMAGGLLILTWVGRQARDRGRGRRAGVAGQLAT